MLLARYFLLIYFPDFFPSSEISSHFTDWKNATPSITAHRTTEWLRGETLCTYRAKYHLAWSVPMADVTYYVPSASIHSFLMFAPFFVMKWNMIIQGIFLWLAGPYLASWITPNLMEQASIWCFFSIAQIGIMLFLIRESLILNWGRTKTTSASSLHVTHENGKKESNGQANGNGHSNGNGNSNGNKKVKAH